MSKTERQPSAEYLALLQELMECRDDDALHNIQARLQNVFDRECNRSTKLRFIERYESGNASLHIHCSGLLLRSNERFEFCAILHSKAGARMPAMCENGFPVYEAGNRQIQISVLVDVRELGQQSEVIRCIPSGSLLRMR